MFRGRLGQEADAVLPVMIDVPFVVVEQNDTAFKVGSACGPFPPASNPQREGIFCWWSPVEPYTVSGRLLKNTSLPIIERVVANVGFSSIELWSRSAADEPDPESFSVAMPIAAPGPQPTAQLRVELVNDFDVRTQLLTLQSASSSHGKFLQSVFDGATGTFNGEVSKRRNVGASYRVLNNIPGMSDQTYETLTVSNAKPGDNFGQPGLGQLVRFVSGNSFSETAYEFYKVVPLEEAPAEYASLGGPYSDPQTGQGPKLTWEHTVRRKYAEAEQAFLRLIFGEPRLNEFRITAAETGAP